MSTPTIPAKNQVRLRSHFAFTGLPFRKNVPAQHMFDSQSQRELVYGLKMWLEIQGISLVVGASGSGKSISIRRFVDELPRERYTVLLFGQVPTRPMGFLRALSRRLDLRPRQHTMDMFDAIRESLGGWHDRHGTHPLIVFDDAEGMTIDTLDLVRRLTATDLDAEDRFSLLIAGTDDLLRTLRDPRLEPLRTRFAYTEVLRPFSIEDTRNYVRFHLAHAGARDDIITDGAVTSIFHTSQGIPRIINQLALQALIHAAVRGLDAIDEPVMKRVLVAHPLYATSA